MILAAAPRLSSLSAAIAGERVAAAKRRSGEVGRGPFELCRRQRKFSTVAVPPHPPRFARHPLPRYRGGEGSRLQRLFPGYHPVKIGTLAFRFQQMILAAATDFLPSPPR